jgi:large subunit ribosomal protein L32
VAPTLCRLRTADCGRPVARLAPLMAVPKQKQSHARTNKRRSQHKIEAPRLSTCPQCHSPRLPHRVCGTCGYYGGREVKAPRSA